MMSKTIVAAGIGLVFVVSHGMAQREAGPAEGAESVAAAPAPWLQQDPGDSLYDAGRTALNRSNYRVAVDQFRALRTRYPSSGYVADGYYWEAYALAKLGSKEDLRVALALLESQAERFPDARTARDARELRVRIQGDLAQLGDAASAAAVAQAVAPLSPRPAVAPAPARAPKAASPTTPVPAAAPAVAGRGRGTARAVAQEEANACSEEDDERLIALNALLQMQEERATPILRQVLERRDPGSVCLRRQAVFMLSQNPSPETAAILLSAARNDPDAEVRENAVFWLSEVDSPEAVAALDSILQHGADAEVQAKAVFALSQQNSPEAARALRAHLEREGLPDEVKENIIFWLGQEKSSENAQFLRQFYGTAASAALKEKVLFSLAQMGLPENARWLMGIAQDEREPMEVRKNALFWAGQMDEVPFAELAGLYDRVQSREMKEQLVFVYSQRRDPEAVTKMMAIARTETDPELRKNAIFWLTQSRDPRVADFLLEIVNK